MKKVLNFDGVKSKKNKGKASKKSDIKSSKKKKDNSSSEDEDDIECLYCFHRFSESNEGWVQCPVCRLWAGIDDEAVFLCERCA